MSAYKKNSTVLYYALSNADVLSEFHVEVAKPNILWSEAPIVYKENHFSGELNTIYGWHNARTE